MSGPALEVDYIPSIAGDSRRAGHNEADTTIGGLNPYAGRHKGFRGFVNLRPVPDHGLLPSPPPPEPTAPPKPERVWSLSQLAASGDQGGGFLRDHYQALLGSAGRVSAPVRFNRPVKVLHRVNPEYPEVARAMETEGEITILVYIDERGNVSEFPEWLFGEGVRSMTFRTEGGARTIDYALSEDPPGWGFGEAFFEVFPLWEFGPRLERGKAVASVLCIKYNFCLGINCSRLMVQSID
jgi:hypothetical protein